MGGTGPEESTDKSAKWRGEETEESVSEEETKTAEGAREVGMMQTATAEGPEGSNA